MNNIYYRNVQATDVAGILDYFFAGKMTRIGILFSGIIKKSVIII